MILENSGLANPSKQPLVDAAFEPEDSNLSGRLQCDEQWVSMSDTPINAKTLTTSMSTLTLRVQSHGATILEMA